MASLAGPTDLWNTHPDLCRSSGTGDPDLQVFMMNLGHVSTYRYL
jgi:hypothetical protein